MPTLKPTPSSKSPKTPATLSLLRRAYSPTTARSIHDDKFHNKTLSLAAAPTTATAPESRDARERRRAARNAKLQAQGKRRRKRPQPLSAAEKRKLCLYDIPKSERRYELYQGLHRLWCRYMREILFGWPMDLSALSAAEVTAHKAEKARKLAEVGGVRLEPQQAGAKLASADFHGAVVEVVRSGCVDKVAVRGVVVRDTMGTFVVVTEGDEVKILPKEGTVFRFVVPVDEDEDVDGAEGKAKGRKEAGRAGCDDTAQLEKAEKGGFERADDEQKSLGQQVEGQPRRKPLIFEIHGEQFKVRAPDRANKKFRLHISPDL